MKSFRFSIFKVIVSIVFIALTIFGTNLDYIVRATLRPVEQTSPVVQDKTQDPEPVKDLGDGFQSKGRVINNQDWVLVKLPEQYLDGSKPIAVFLGGVSIGLVKTVGCQDLECLNNKPNVLVSPPPQEPGDEAFMLVKMKIGKYLKLEFMSDGTRIVGFAFTLPKVPKPVIS